MTGDNPRRGEVWWADLGTPRGSLPGYRRPVVILQSDLFNNSRIATIVVIPLTGELRRVGAPGLVLLRPVETGLRRDSVAAVTQIMSVNRGDLDEAVGRLPPRPFLALLDALDVVVGR